MGSCAAPSAKGDDKFITTDYLQQCLKNSLSRYKNRPCRNYAGYFTAAGPSFSDCPRVFHALLIVQ
ncbi:hypothetical protein F8B94_25910 [Escherichia coli]|nr:hypothetical protein [Escherichia coli]